MLSMTNAHALIIGIANYQHINGLSATVLKDARDIYNLLVDPNHCAFPIPNVQLILDGQATQTAIRQGLNDLASRCNSDSVVFFYLSSHGGRIETGLHAGEYLLPVDVVYSSAQSIAQTAISGTEFTAKLRAISARKIVVIFDCCHSGGIGQPKDPCIPLLKALPESYYETLKAGQGRVIMASSRSGEYSYITPGSSNSLFTLHLLDGLRGNAPGPGGVIRIFDLFHYLQPRVVAQQPNQHPIFKAEVEENFPVALYLGGKAPVEHLPNQIDGFKYDVFLSYRNQEPDKSWVRKTLLPHLEATGLRACIDCRDFRLGAPIIREIERAVEESRYTLAVLSPAYLDSSWTNLESVLAQHLGLENSERRLLMVLREPCKPSLSMRARIWLDMTDNDNFILDSDRLIYELRQATDG